MESGMPPPPSSSSLNWSQCEMAGARLPDRRFAANFALLLDRLVSGAGLSLSAACGPALRQSAHRLFSDEDAAPERLLEGHVQSPRSRCEGRPRIVVAQDTTTFSYPAKRGKSGFGPVNDSPFAAGLLVHSALAVAPDGLPVGVLHLECWARGEEKAKPRRTLSASEKESGKWLRGLAGVEKALLPYLDSGGEAVLVQDREADVFDLFGQLRHERLHLIVRAAQPRIVFTGGEAEERGERASLFDAVAASPSLGEIPLLVPAKSIDQPERQTALEMRSVELNVPPPKGRKSSASSSKPLRLWAVQAKEKREGEGQEKSEERLPLKDEPICWTLICTEPSGSFEQAVERIEAYRLRWTIERLHYALKSGFSVEELQIEEAHELKNALAVYFVAAWRILWLSHLGRTSPESPAEEAMDADALAVLRRKSGRAVSTIRAVIEEIARLGGHSPYKNGPPPGPKRLWIGLRMLEGLVQGYRLAALPSRNVNQA